MDQSLKTKLHDLMKNCEQTNDEKDAKNSVDEATESVLQGLIGELLDMGRQLYEAGLYDDFPLWKKNVIRQISEHPHLETNDKKSYMKYATAKALCTYFIHSGEKHMAFGAFTLATELVRMGLELKELSRDEALLHVIKETL
ncbi:hypothetical protein Xmau_03799 [Xenorhabdus mauleonii]|uniref:Uncharacterized protein n=1 Tax=Xenorhabdus mauleonii TaxID=351675 RepID=A0A1I3V3C4_9GAMM|nr:hypothetical protein [Xenorhabdus mauleonii]PHM37582.1 hypothetical protein Xmau_03799 [Xenorhabdus mauleonii]SFJ88856.1 hypothetical protein SAMN05421680_1194 [Xenorhabdus mauleonii]